MMEYLILVDSWRSNPFLSINILNCSRDTPGYVYLPVTRADLGPRQVTANITAAGIRSTSEFGSGGHGGGSSGHVGGSSGHGGPPAQSAPVNLTVSDRNVRYILNFFYY